MKKKKLKELKEVLDCSKFINMKECYIRCLHYPVCRLIYVVWRNKDARK